MIDDWVRVVRVTLVAALINIQQYPDKRNSIWEFSIEPDNYNGALSRKLTV